MVGNVIRARPRHYFFLKLKLKSEFTTKLTVCWPAGNNDPDTLLQAMPATPTLSVAVMLLAKLTAVRFAVAGRLKTKVGHVITGNSV